MQWDLYIIGVEFEVSSKHLHLRLSLVQHYVADMVLLNLTTSTTLMICIIGYHRFIMGSLEVKIS